MRDQQQRAFEFGQGVGQGVTGVGVEVVGGFVQHQKTGLLPGQQGQTQAGLLAAGHRPGGAQRVVARKAEGAQEAAQHLLALLRCLAGQVLQRGVVGAQVFDLLLGEVARIEGGGTGEVAGDWHQIADQRADQRGLAGAVAAQNADAGAAAHDQLGQRDDGLLRTVAADEVLGADQWIGALGRLGKLEIDAAGGTQRGDGLHPLQRLQAALRLPGLGGLGAEAGNEPVEVLDAGLLFAAFAFALGGAFGADVLAGGVAAGVAVESAVLDDQAGGGHAVEKVAVVRDDQLDGGVAHQLPFQPQHGVQVEVVGGLVQQQQVAGGHQHAGQIQAHLPAARQFVDGTGELRLAKAQTVEQFGCAGLGRGATGVDPVGVGFAHGLSVAVGLGLPDGGFCGDQGGIGVHHEANGVDAGLGRMLGQPGDAQLRQVDIALFGREITPQQGQQRAFAAAVGADEGHALTGVDDERGVAE